MPSLLVGYEIAFPKQFQKASASDAYLPLMYPDRDSLPVLRQHTCRLLNTRKWRLSIINALEMLQNGVFPPNVRFPLPFLLRHYWWALPRRTDEGITDLLQLVFWIEETYSAGIWLSLLLRGVTHARENRYAMLFWLARAEIASDIFYMVRALARPLFWWYSSISI